MTGVPPSADPQSILASCAAIDLEIDARGRIREAGAVRGDAELRLGAAELQRDGIAELEHFAQGAAFIVGHNVLFHDLDALRRVAPHSALLDKPVLDTLLLSPLAYPRRPYHRLIKDYKLVRASANDPVADARLALRVLGDCIGRIAKLPVPLRGLCAWAVAPCIAACPARREQRAEFVAESPAHRAPRRSDAERRSRPARASDRGGHASLLRALAAVPPDEPAAAFAALTEGLTCRSATGPAFAEQAARERLPLAYVASWIDTKDPGSVLPAWLRHTFPDVIDLVQRLRGTACSDPRCTWCRSEHDADVQLRRAFGYDGFRPEPRTAEGRSLQRAVVEHGMGGGSLLAILPTGAGKSLCFQVPALVRHRRSGQLTVVVSPLQALMKDQVDGFERRTQSGAAAALNGLLTPPERADVLERVRLGEIALLYLSPEQLRSTTCRKALEQREIGCWVFDEAHCLSKWGHDFRPDYLYAARFIRELAEREQQPVPTIACLTATAKRDVRDEILEHFRRELGRELVLFEGGVERRNLDFAVEGLPHAQRYARIGDLCEQTIADRGSVIVYCATRRETEALAEFLQGRGVDAVAYHAGLDAAQRRERQNAFLADERRIVCATNAFGMGIDKPDVRLVVHARMPASLENYLQEAGRAGRDQGPARCVLLHTDDDADEQFRLLAMSRLSQHDIAQILAALRRLRRRRRGDDDEVVVTAGELLREGETDTSFDAGSRDAPTRVATAIAWLERGGFVRRDENRVGLIAARPKLRDDEELKRTLAKLRLPHLEAAMWRQAYRAVAAARPDQGLDTDDLASLPAFETWDAQRLSAADAGERATSASQKVLRVLHAMAKAGLVSDSVRLTAFVRDRVVGSSQQRFDAIAVLERAMVDLLREQEPDPDDRWLPLSFRQLNQALLDRGTESHPDRLRRLLRGLSHDGRGLANRQGSLELRNVGREGCQLRLRRRWDDLVVTAELRLEVARLALGAMLQRIPAGAPPRKDQLVEFSIEDVRSAIDGDLLLAGQLNDPLAAIDRALMFLHELDIVVLQRGLAVFRRAMTLRVPAGERRRYADRDFAALRDHYAQQTQGVHVMARYAEQGATDIDGAHRLVADYFALSCAEFVRRHCVDHGAEWSRQTAPQSYQQIVDALANPAQQAIVTAVESGSTLVLAGPGSGKTRVVVHRCAYLLRVLRVPAQSILAICFNRATAIELRRRLAQLVGADSAGVTVTTYHGIAARLCGRSFVGRAADRPVDRADLDQLLVDAVELLEGRQTLLGLEADEQREHLLAGFRHVLVDEYQDIDERQYDLVRALARGGAEGERPSLLAVGDDDQAIYGFRDASTAFIARFCADYDARVLELVENYRSTAPIIAASNRVIAAGTQRMKREPIRIDAQRRDRPPGAAVELVEVELGSLRAEHALAAAAFDELMRLRAAWPQRPWSDIAVLAWHRETLAPLRAYCEARGVPVRWAADQRLHIAPWAIREVAAWLGSLRVRLRSGSGTLRASELCALRAAASAATPDSPWWDYVDGLAEAWATEVGADVDVPATRVLDFLTDCMAEDRRQRALQDGVELRTLHGAKGLEFPAVVLLDRGFGADDGSTRAEEERRLFYVGMTRAMERLTVVAGDGLRNPHAARIAAGDCARRRVTPAVDAATAADLARCFVVLPLDQLFVDFAGQRPAAHPIHAALRMLQAGSDLYLVDRRPRVQLVDAAGLPVAELSVRGSEHWRPQLDQVEQVRVLAMLRRTREQVAPHFRAGCVADTWELPLVEFTYRPARAVEG